MSAYRKKLFVSLAGLVRYESTRVLLVVCGAVWGVGMQAGCGSSTHERLPDDEQSILRGLTTTDYATLDAGRRRARTAVRLWQESRAQLRFETSDLDQMETLFPVSNADGIPETRTLYDSGSTGAVRLLFMDGFQLSSAGQEVVRLVSEVGSHGLDDSGYLSDRLTCVLTKLQELAGFEQDGLDVELATDDPHLLRALTADIVVPTGPEQFELFAQAHLPAVWTKMASIKPILAERGRLVREADFLLARAFSRLFVTFRKEQPDHPNDATITKDEIKAGIRNPGDTIAAMLPWSDQYTSLRAAYTRYRELVASDTIRPLTITKPHRVKARYVGDEVVALRQRLAAEGYVAQPREGTPTNLFDDSLVDTLGQYQADHQLEPTGKLDAVTLKALNVSMDTRAAQIAVALRQWRRSKLNQETAKVIIQVNIPAFEAHFFSNRELKRSHRVVVGNNGWVYDKIINKKGFLNRTGLMTSAIQTVILNPAWRVPPRIKQDELDKEHAKDSTYYERHNFVVTTHADGSESVMQRPGPGNALGVVKMAFPNDQGIYMHDTAQKEYFARPVRAYSHGCVRLQNPMDAAAFLLEQDGNHASGNEQTILKSRKETAIRLNTPVPIHIEYIPVSVSESGRVLFHTDIYSMLGKTVAATAKRLFDRPTEPLSKPGTNIPDRCADARISPMPTNSPPEMDAKAVD